MMEYMCESVRERIVAFIENELSVDEARAVAEHVERCEKCQLLVRDLKTGRQLIKTLRKPHVDMDRIQERIDSALAEHVGRRSEPKREADAIFLQLEQCGKNIWRVCGIPFDMPLTDYAIESELELADGSRVIASLLNETDPAFEFQLEGNRMAAGSAQEVMQRTKGSAYCAQKSVASFELVQDAEGRFMFRLLGDAISRGPLVLSPTKSGRRNV